MSPSIKEQIFCDDCGAAVDADPVQISATEYLCRSCWPFLLKPLVREDATGTNNGTPI